MRAAGVSWLVVAVLGQLVFASYIAVFYGRALFAGRPQDWNRVLAKGYVPGETAFNLVLGVHLLFAVLIIAGGALQLLPWLRRNAPGFHGWTGRLYLAVAATLAAGGLVLVWWRGGAAGDLWQRLGVSLNALLVLIFAALAWRAARSRRLEDHRRWALRLFLAVSGVWFFRIGLMLWIAANGAPAGFDPETFTGPTLTILSFAQVLLPLAVLELYFRSMDQGGTWHRRGVAAGIGLCTLATAAGIAAASSWIWLPRL